MPYNAKQHIFYLYYFVFAVLNMFAELERNKINKINVRLL